MPLFLNSYQVDSRVSEIRNLTVGVRGVSLSYVIREDVQSRFDPDIPYDEAVIQGVPMYGPEFKIDSRTVHQIILLF